MLSQTICDETFRENLHESLRSALKVRASHWITLRTPSVLACQCDTDGSLYSRWENESYYFTLIHKIILFYEQNKPLVIALTILQGAYKMVI